jgi:hypothetical protein
MVISVQRSAQSLRFEQALRPPAPGVMPKLSEIDYSTVSDLAPWIAVVDPDRAMMTLRFTAVGAGIAAFVGEEPVGMDYLDWVDSSIKGDAFDSCMVMLSRPCGLWQITPVMLANGTQVMIEYTGFPVFDEVRRRGQIIFLATHALKDVAKVPHAKTAQHSTTWKWLEFRS